jgi:hypothetical protein
MKFGAGIKMLTSLVIEIAIYQITNYQIKNTNGRFEAIGIFLGI